MNYDLSPVLHKSAVVFFDDILVYSQTIEEHVQHLKEVLQLLQKHQWQVKSSKYEFAVPYCLCGICDRWQWCFY